jgi:hypothetical protein
MASQVLSGNSNPTYTNNTGQNVRIVINFMDSTVNGDITMNWAGISISESDVESIGKNIACANAFYGDYFWSPFTLWRWWFAKGYNLNPRATLSTQNAAIRLPVTEVEFTKTRRGFRRWLFSVDNISGFSLSVALPLEIFLAPGQTFSAICGAYNIVAIKEDGN